jgi:Alginate lyase
MKSNLYRQVGSFAGVVALCFTAKWSVAADVATAIDLKSLDHERVLKAADQYMSEKPITITAYPASRSAGGLHDYFSEADYFWPDPANPDGPYINRDGMSNPNNFNEHRHALIRMSIQVPALVAAYEISGDRKYADHAMEHLRAWFVDDATQMNPSLPYAQAVHGRVTGRSYGIIDTLHLVEVSRAIVVLRDHHAIDAKDDAAISQWFTDYLKWLTTNQAGITEGNSQNNHATCYWLQIAAFATLVNDQAKLEESRKRYKEQLLPQMGGDGSFPKELARTKPYGYSMFDLDQMVTLCQMLSTPTDNLWTFALADGRTIRKGVEYMYPYVKDKSTWPLKPDVMYYQFWPARSPAWLFAGWAFGDQKYLDLWKSLEANPTNDEVLRNLPLRQPVLWEN